MNVLALLIGAAQGKATRLGSVHTFKRLSLLSLSFCTADSTAIIIKILSFVTVINLDPRLRLCCVGSLNWREFGLISP